VCGFCRTWEDSCVARCAPRFWEEPFFSWVRSAHDKGDMGRLRTMNEDGTRTRKMRMRRINEDEEAQEERTMRRRMMRMTSTMTMTTMTMTVMVTVTMMMNCKQTYLNCRDHIRLIPSPY